MVLTWQCVVFLTTDSCNSRAYTGKFGKWKHTRNFYIALSHYWLRKQESVRGNVFLSLSEMFMVGQKTYRKHSLLIICVTGYELGML